MADRTFSNYLASRADAGPPQPGDVAFVVRGGAVYRQAPRQLSASMPVSASQVIVALADLGIGGPFILSYDAAAVSGLRIRASTDGGSTYVYDETWTSADNITFGKIGAAYVTHLKLDRVGSSGTASFFLTNTAIALATDGDPGLIPAKSANTSRAITLADKGFILLCDNVGAVVYTIPTEANLAWDRSKGMPWFGFQRLGNGIPSVAPVDSGVTSVSNLGQFEALLNGPYGVCYSPAPNVWII